ncbi:MAG: UTP--glucose-1-phosphate uridylyltransferase GalU [Alphaproteobacteria bacterium]|nr:UTP--glucose-1-phosphate uridylyltransferase GalU [Alphaproteobacteria bacterium]
MSQQVKKAVFPVAGFGTRMLPATKSVPKELLPVVNKPLIQYAFEEACAAGIEEFIFVTGRGKQALEDHFDHSVELENTLTAKGKFESLSAIKDFLPDSGKIKYVRQMQANGLGHAILCARDFIGDEKFAIISPDDLVLSPDNAPCIGQLINASFETGGNIVGVMDVDISETAKYGILDTPNAHDKLSEIRGLVEKPAPKEAPSTLSIIGRYVLSSKIFSYLENQKPDMSGEIQLTDAMARMLDDQPFHGLRFEGIRFDCGSRLGWLEANIAFAAQDETLRSKLKNFTSQYLADTEKG